MRLGFESLSCSVDKRRRLTADPVDPALEWCFESSELAAAAEDCNPMMDIVGVHMIVGDTDMAVDLVEEAGMVEMRNEY